RHTINRSQPSAKPARRSLHRIHKCAFCSRWSCCSLCIYLWSWSSRNRSTSRRAELAVSRRGCIKVSRNDRSSDDRGRSLCHAVAMEANWQGAVAFRCHCTKENCNGQGDGKVCHHWRYPCTGVRRGNDSRASYIYRRQHLGRHRDKVWQRL